MRDLTAKLQNTPPFNMHLQMLLPQSRSRHTRKPRSLSLTFTNILGLWECGTAGALVSLPFLVIILSLLERGSSEFIMLKKVFIDSTTLTLLTYNTGYLRD